MPWLYPGTRDANHRPAVRERSGTLSDAQFAGIRGLLGEAEIVEVTTLIGWCTMVALTRTAFGAREVDPRAR